MIRPVSAFALSCIALAVGCGGATALPDPPPCVTPTPTPAITTRGQLGQVTASGAAYYRTLNDGSTRLQALTHEFRDRWPDGKFYHQPDFRTDFVAYAGQSNCVAADLQALEGTASTRYAGLRERLNPVFADYQSNLKAGRDAVRTRNVTDYRAFNKRLDDLAAKMDDALAAYRTGVPSP